MTQSIQNKPELLDEMMSDIAVYDGELGPGKYWIGHQSYTVNWIKKNGLDNFRKFNSVETALRNFGGSSFWPKAGDSLAAMESINNNFFYKVSQKLSFQLGIKFFQRSLRQEVLLDTLRLGLMMTWCEFLSHLDEDDVMSNLEVTPVGNPTDIIRFDDRNYSPIMLKKIGTYLTLNKRLGLSDVKRSLELGAGTGALAEVMAKLHSGMQLYLVDIPPQLYVLQQNLSAIFPGEVATYDVIKSDPSVLLGDQYRIFCMAPWQLETGANLGLKVDVAIAQHLHEMDKNTVSGYLQLWKKVEARKIFISSLFQKRGHPEFKTFSPDDFSDFFDKHTHERTPNTTEFSLPNPGARTVHADDLNKESLGSQGYILTLMAASEL